MIRGVDPTFPKITMTDATQPPNQAMQRTANRPYAYLSLFYEATCNSRGR
jgi:hypothetical protein